MFLVLLGEDSVAANAASDNVGACAGDDFADDVFDELFRGCRHEFGARGGAAVWESFFVANGNHAGLDGVDIGKLARFAGKGLVEPFLDFHLPI